MSFCTVFLATLFAAVTRGECFKYLFCFFCSLKWFCDIEKGALEYVDCGDSTYRARLIRDTVAQTLRVEYSGTTAGWMGVGLGGSAMSGTYALIVLYVQIPCFFFVFVFVFVVCHSFGTKTHTHVYFSLCFVCIFNIFQEQRSFLGCNGSHVRFSPCRLRNYTQWNHSHFFHVLYSFFLSLFFFFLDRKNQARKKKIK